MFIASHLTGEVTAVDSGFAIDAADARTFGTERAAVEYAGTRRGAILRRGENVRFFLAGEQRFATIRGTEELTTAGGGFVELEDYRGERFTIHGSELYATACECSEDYGACELHATTLVQREGAAVRSADELAILFLEDAADVLEELHGADHATTRQARILVNQAARLAWDGSWLADAGEAEDIREDVELLEGWLAPLFVEWEDGFRIVRVSHDAPLFRAYELEPREELEEPRYRLAPEL